LSKWALAAHPDCSAPLSAQIDAVLEIAGL